MLGVKLWKS